jgi:hypothetical protein
LGHRELGRLDNSEVEQLLTIVQLSSMFDVDNLASSSLELDSCGLEVAEIIVARGRLGASRPVLNSAAAKALTLDTMTSSNFASSFAPYVSLD